MNSDDRKNIQRIIELGATAVGTGLVHGSGGNISVRAHDGESFWITGSGTWFDRLTVEDFGRVALIGDVLAGAKPSSEWKMHQHIYQARPDVNAVVHLHPQHSVLLDGLGHQIRFFTLDDALYVKSVGTVPYHPNGATQLAVEVAQQMDDHNCVVMRNHGCACAGEDLEMAFRRAVLLEQAATNTYRALLLGDQHSAFPDGVELTHA
ncbi:MAG: class II aldolase/adducin family protein [Beutenbergiaceae bacterium]